VPSELDLKALRSMLPDAPSGWLAFLTALPEPDAYILIAPLYALWQNGEGCLFFDGEPGLSSHEADRRLGRLFHALPAGLTEDLCLRRFWADEGDVRRWCWAHGPYFSEDGDGILDDEASIVPIFDEVRAGCPERASALGLVERNVRRHVHSALWKGEPELRQQLLKAGALVDPARAAAADELAAYFERLASYASVGKVDREGANQRVLDLRPPYSWPAGEPELHRKQGYWSAPFPEKGQRPGVITIQSSTGRMRVERVTPSEGR
jgi:hypothetical protein